MAGCFWVAVGFGGFGLAEKGWGWLGGHWWPQEVDDEEMHLASK